MKSNCARVKRATTEWAFCRLNQSPKHSVTVTSFPPKTSRLTGNKRTREITEMAHKSVRFLDWLTELEETQMWRLLSLVFFHRKIRVTFRQHLSSVREATWRFGEGAFTPEARLVWSRPGSHSTAHTTCVRTSLQDQTWSFAAGTVLCYRLFLRHQDTCGEIQFCKLQGDASYVHRTVYLSWE